MNALSWSQIKSCHQIWKKFMIYWHWTLKYWIDWFLWLRSFFLLFRSFFFWNTKTKTIHSPPICLCQSHSLPYLQRTLDRAFHSPINPSVCLICDSDTFSNSCSCFFIHFFVISFSFFISSVVLSWYFVGFIHPNRESYETASISSYQDKTLLWSL